MTPLEAAQKIDAFREAVLSDFRPIAEAIYPDVVDGVEETFITEGYGTWRPLSPAYARRKRITHPGKTILRRDDHYFNAATQPNHHAHVKQVDRASLTVGVLGRWFAARFGFDYPARHETDRPVYRLLSIRQQFLQRLEGAVVTLLKRELKGIGF
jgi:hypothetical protein